MKNRIAIALILTGLFTPQISRANPAALPAIPALCSTGVGCILVGTVFVGGTVAYVWQNGGQRFIANAAGGILRMLDDPDDDAGSTVPLNAKSWQAALRECAYHFYGRKFRVFMRKGVWYCTTQVDI